MPARFLVLALFLVLSASMGSANDRTAEIRVSKDHPFEITGLGFYPGSVSIEVENEGTPNQVTHATLRGAYSRSNWRLLGPEREILSNSTGERALMPFEVKVQLTGIRTPVRFTAVGPHGLTQEDSVIVIYPAYVAGSEGSNEIASLGSGWAVALGITSSSFSETGLANFTEVSLTPKISYQHPLSSNWDLGGNIFITAVPLLTSESGVSAYFLGVNARAGYRLPWLSKPWTLSLAGGIYYTTMFTSGRTFGFTNMVGPQLFPTLRRTIGERYMAGIYTKYSPVTSGGAPLSFSSHELATGGSFTVLLPNRRTISVTLDYSYISVNVSPLVATNSAFTGGVTYGF